MSAIVQSGDAVLREQAIDVPEDMFGSTALDALIEDMARALDAEPDGVALAAPQIGVSYRIFIARLDRIAPVAEDGTRPPREIAVFINPTFIRTSQRRIEMDEGCLSVRGIYGKTKRHERATVRARAVDGSTFERGGGGILAQIYQHEIDHLEGILFTDHAVELVEVMRGEETTSSI